MANNSFICINPLSVDEYVNIERILKILVMTETIDAFHFHFIAII